MPEITPDLHTAKRSAYLWAAAYYIVLWGMLSMTNSYMAIDLNQRGVTELQ